MSYPNGKQGTALVLAAAGIGAAIGYMLANSTARTDPRLIALVEQLVAADRASGAIAVGLTALGAILAALVIPIATIFAVVVFQRREENREQTYLAKTCRRCRLSDQARLDPGLGRGRRDHRPAEGGDGCHRLAGRGGGHRALGPKIPRDGTR